MGLKYIFSFTFLLCLNSYSQTEIITKIDNYLNKNVKYDNLLFVSIENQKMYRIQSKDIIETYDISTSCSLKSSFTENLLLVIPERNSFLSWFSWCLLSLI